MTLVRRFALAAALAALSACGSTRGSTVVLGARQAAFQGAVRVTREAALPGFALTEIGLVQAVGSGNQNDLGTIVARLQAEAAALGADAVIRMRFDPGFETSSAIGVAVRSRPAAGPQSGFEAYVQGQAVGSRAGVWGEAPSPMALPPEPRARGVMNGPAPGELRPPWQR